MRIIEAESEVLKDLKEEGRVVVERAFPGFTVITLRHPTLGKLVLVQGSDGSGAIVEADE